MLTELRVANKARQAVWVGGQNITIAFRAVELMGEIGEMVSVLNQRDSIERLSEEIGDVIICADLLAMEVGVELEYVDQAKVCANLGEHLILFNTVKKILRQRNDIMGNVGESLLERQLASELSLFVGAITLIADSWMIDAEDAVRQKFNKTSRKHGLDVFMS